MALFTEDTHFVVYMNAKDPTPSMELHSREALAPIFADLNEYDATTHFIGQSTTFTLTADRATGETYCLAHHVTVDGGKRRLMVASLRYLDTFVKKRAARGCLRNVRSTSIGWRSAHSHDTYEIGPSSGQLVEKEIKGDNPAVPDDDEICPGVDGGLAGAARYPLEPPAIVQFLRLGN